MKIGLMADTHDNLEATERAVTLFNEQQVGHVLHAGDLVSPFTASKFLDLEPRFHFVWGNNEGDRLHALKKLEEVAGDSIDEFLALELDGLKIALLHGTNEKVVDALAESKKFDVVVRGHTHEPEIREDPLVINPGTASGYLADRKTVAVLDTEKKDAEILSL